MCLKQFLMQGHNIMMQIKQLKSIINANYFSPWSIDPPEDDAFPTAPPPSFPKFKKYVQAVQECLDRKGSIEEQAKKTLLNIDDELRRKKVGEHKSCSKKRSIEVDSVFPQGINQLKLPPINGLIDYTHCCVLENDIQQSNLTSLDDSFRRMGKFKGRGKPNALGRNLSDVSPPLLEDISIIAALKRKFETIAVSYLKSKDFSLKKDLKLKGKRFSLDERRSSSERQLQIDRGIFIPTKPDITPHRLLIGHKQDEVLKKVLQQLHGRPR